MEELQRSPGKLREWESHGAAELWQSISRSMQEKARKGKRFCRERGGSAAKLSAPQRSCSADFKKLFVTK